MSLQQQYRETVMARFPNPSPEMAAYVEGMDHRETDAELEAQQARWEALTQVERDTCWSIASSLTGEA